MANHTPGPWHVGGREDVVVYAADGFAVADAKTFHGKHEASAATANARVIAAAPDMLEALKLILSPSPHYGATQAHRDRIAEARAKGLAAIAKAEGNEGDR